VKNHRIPAKSWKEMNPTVNRKKQPKMKSSGREYFPEARAAAG